MPAWTVVGLFFLLRAVQMSTIFKYAGVGPTMFISINQEFGWRPFTLYHWALFKALL